MSDELQKTAIKEITNTYQVTEGQLIVFGLIIFLIWSAISYFIQLYFQKNLMEDIELKKSEMIKQAKQIEYKQNYFSKIIDKRIKSYEDIDMLFGLIDVVVERNIRKKKYNYFDCLISIESYNKIDNKIMEVCSNSLFITHEMELKINKLNEFLNQTKNKFFKNNTRHFAKEIDYKKESEKLEAILLECQEQLADDMIELYDVNKYLLNKKEKIKNQYFPVSK